MKRFLTLVIVFGFIFGMSGIQVSAEDQVKLGMVSAKRIFEESKAGKEAYKELRSMQEQLRVGIEARKAEIDTMEENFQKQRMTLSEDARREKAEEISKARIDFKRMLEDADAEIAAKEKTFLEKIDREVMKLIDEIGKAEGYTMIFSETGGVLLYVSQTMDITEQVIKAYDASITQ